MVIIKSVEDSAVDKDSISVDLVVRYLDLLSRSSYIVLHSGIDWKPEYEQELKLIDSEIEDIRRQMGLPAVYSGK